MRRSILALLLALAVPAAAQPQPAVEVDETRISLAARGPRRVALFTPRAEGPKPLVLVLHGYGMGPEEYKGLARRLAARGNAVVLFEGPMAGLDLDPDSWRRELSGVLDGLEKSQAPELADVDRSRVGLVGHSLGGATAALGAAEDPRVGAVVLMSPGTHILYRARLLQAARRIRVPLLLIGARNDAVTPTPLFAGALYDAAPTPERMLVELRGANHFNFAELPFWKSPLFMPTEWVPGLGAEVAPSRQREVAADWADAWLERFLRLGAATDLERAAERDKERGLLSEVRVGPGLTRRPVERTVERGESRGLVGEVARERASGRSRVR